MVFLEEVHHSSISFFFFLIGVFLKAIQRRKRIFFLFLLRRHFCKHCEKSMKNVYYKLNK